MIRQNKKIIIKNILYPSIGIVIFFAVWAAVCAVYNQPLMLESPLNTIVAALNLLKTANFWLRIYNSFMRAVFGYAISISLALGLALLCTVFDIKKILSPLITIVRAVPTVTVILLIFLWTDPFATPVIVSVLVVFPTIYSSFLVVLGGVNKDLCESARVFGCGKVGLIRHVYFPLLKRGIVENTASGLSLAFKLVISAEIIYPVKNSIGAFIKTAEHTLQMANFFAAALMMTFICIALEILIRFLLVIPFFND